jgi:Glutaredoxin-like domain (DUF836)
MAGVGGRLVRMYSRKDCGLCDQAREIIASERRRAEFRFDEVIIDGDPALERRYGLRVPVVDVDGTEEFEYVVDPDRLGELLRR